jgi:serine/threonine protein kinase
MKKLGEGAFGQALLAKNKEDDTMVVIKTVNLEALDEEGEEKAINEGNILRKVSRDLQHDNIVKFYGFYLCANEAVLIMEYIEGGDLRGKIEEAKLWRKKIDEKTILTWLKEISSALKFCHEEKHIIHRDIKPENILLTKDDHIKIADFGIAKNLQKAKVAKTIIGDMDYISPEIMKKEAYTYSTDIWSLGILIYELCLLEHPQKKYRLNNIKYINGEIPELNDKDYSKDLSDLIKRMLNVKPDKRPTAAEILEICETLLKKGNSGYQGEMVNGVREGKGTYCFENGDKYEGFWKNNKMEGKGVYYFHDGDKYDGEWIDGKKEGQGIYTFSSGAKYEGNWVQGKMEGSGIFYYSNGDKYDGEWKDNKKEGNGIYYYSNGCKYEGEWKNDKKDGNGTLTCVIKGIWSNNQYQNS